MDEDVIIDVDYEEIDQKKTEDIKYKEDINKYTKDIAMTPEERKKLPISKRVYKYDEITETLEYTKKELPTILDSEGKPIPLKVDKKGGLRHAEKGYILKGSKPINFAKPSEEYSGVKDYIKRHLSGDNGEKIFNFLFDVMNYNQKAKKDKVAEWKPADRMKAAELLLAYGFDKPVAKSQSTARFDHRSVKIVIGQKNTKTSEYE